MRRAGSSPFSTGCSRSIAAARGRTWAFVPPYTTIQVGLLRGGTATNIIAQNCEVDWHFRALPTDDAGAIERRALAFLDELEGAMRGLEPRTAR